MFNFNIYYIIILFSVLCTLIYLDRWGLSTAVSCGASWILQSGSTPPAVEMHRLIGTKAIFCANAHFSP